MHDKTVVLIDINSDSSFQPRTPNQTTHNVPDLMDLSISELDNELITDNFGDPLAQPPENIPAPPIPSLDDLLSCATDTINISPIKPTIYNQNLN